MVHNKTSSGSITITSSTPATTTTTSGTTTSTTPTITTTIAGTTTTTSTTTTTTTTVKPWKIPRYATINFSPHYRPSFDWHHLEVAMQHIF